MKSVILVLALLVASTAPAGTLYIGTTAKAKPGHLINAWRAVREFDELGIDESDESWSDLLDPDKVERAKKARAALASIVALDGTPTQAEIVAALEESEGVVSVTLVNGQCDDFPKAVQRAASVCGDQDSIEVVSAKSIRRFQCKVVSGSALWGIETCE